MRSQTTFRRGARFFLVSFVSLLLVASAATLVVVAVAIFDPVLWVSLASSPWRVLPRVLLGKGAFWVVAALLLVIPAALSGHYRLIGPKKFSHDGPRYRVFSLITRLNHWVAAVSCTVLILTGVTMMCAGTWAATDTLRGGEVVRFAWRVHAWTAVAFVASVLFMLIGWARAMLPRLHDLKWMIIAGGYLSARKRPVPAHKFNAGQKAWFWLATLGGMAMAGTGLAIHEFRGGMTFLNLVAAVHHALAIAIVTMFVVHVYMAVFAIRGSLGSMLHGHKSEEELAILHPLYHQEICERAAPAATQEEDVVELAEVEEIEVDFWPEHVTQH